MKALVTGAAGFIGAHVVRALLEDGCAVRALHRPQDDLRNLRGLDVELCPGDVTDRAGMLAAARGADWVFHLAAIYALWTRDPARLWHVNVDGTRTVIDAALQAGATRVIVTSSIARFGGQGPGRRATEQSEFRLGATGDLYARSKDAAHDVALAAAGRGDVTIVAPTGPIGPGDVGPTPTGRLLCAVMRMPLAVVTQTTTNFADVRDIARGHVLAAKHGKRGEAYLLGDEDVPLPDLARRAIRIAGRKTRVIAAPFPVARVAGKAALFWADRISHKPPLITPQAVAIAELGLAADCTKARRELGFTSRPLDESLRDALGWFGREGYL